MQTATTTAVAGMQNSNTAAAPIKMQRRIGSTVYEINVYFKHDAAETMNDKIQRLIRNEAQIGRAG
jgi:hypothetical protein